MYIKELYIKNFGIFKGNNTLHFFPTGINLITSWHVGSGKTTVLDAIVWAVTDDLISFRDERSICNTDVRKATSNGDDQETCVRVVLATEDHVITFENCLSCKCSENKLYKRVRNIFVDGVLAGNETVRRLGDFSIIYLNEDLFFTQEAYSLRRAQDIVHYLSAKGSYAKNIASKAEVIVNKWIDLLNEAFISYSCLKMPHLIIPADFSNATMAEPDSLGSTSVAIHGLYLRLAIEKALTEVLGIPSVPILIDDLFSRADIRQLAMAIEIVKGELPQVIATSHQCEQYSVLHDFPIIMPPYKIEYYSYQVSTAYSAIVRGDQ